MLKISLHGFEKASFTSKIARHFCKALLGVLIKMCENCIAILQPPQSAYEREITMNNLECPLLKKWKGRQQFLQLPPQSNCCDPFSN